MIPGVNVENAPKATVAEIPWLERQFPAAVTALHQLELSSRCDLRCGYCPNPDMEKGKPGYRRPALMSEETFALALGHVKHYVDAGTQVELNLAGIGESTLHPQFVEFVERARVLLPRIEFTLATNGIKLSRRDAEATRIAECLAECKVTTYVSQHRQDRAAMAMTFLQRHGVQLGGFSNDPAMNAMDWAGQVDADNIGLRQRAESPCIWLRQGWAFCTADGVVSACCYDAQGIGTIGHVEQKIGTLVTSPYRLCQSCHQHIRVTGHRQRPDRLPTVEED